MTPVNTTSDQARTSKAGARVVSFWAHPSHINHLDAVAAEKFDGNRTAAFRFLIERDMKRGTKR